MNAEEQKLNRKAHELDDAHKKKELIALRATCKHRMSATFDGFDRCEICGQPGEWEAR